MHTPQPDATPPSHAGRPAPYAPYVAQNPDPLIPLPRLDAAAPWRWLKLGWRDFASAPLIGLFYGACFAIMGSLLVVVFRQAPAYVLALSAGFVLVGPFLCLGMYDASRRLERGERARF